MPARADAYREIQRQYQRIRAASEAALRERRAELFKSFPRLEELEREINLTGVRLARIVLSGQKDAAAELKKRLADMKAEKAGIMNAAGLPAGYLDMEYSCASCRDTGSLPDGSRCSCMKQKLIDLAYDQSNIRDVMKIENFNTFNLNYYSSEKDPDKGVSPRENITRILETALDFVENIGKTDNLLFYGDTGLGKTFLCNCIAKAALDKGKSVMYLTAPQLFKRLEREKFSRDTEQEDERGLIDDIIEVDLLIIDDLGAEFPTVLTSSELFNIINARILNSSPVVISTNLSPRDWSEQYSDRVVSRILGTYKSLHFFGGDIRLGKKFGKK